MKHWLDVPYDCGQILINDLSLRLVAFAIAVLSFITLAAAQVEPRQADVAADISQQLTEIMNADEDPDDPHTITEIEISGCRLIRSSKYARDDWFSEGTFQFWLPDMETDPEKLAMASIWNMDSPMRFGDAGNYAYGYKAAVVDDARHNLELFIEERKQLRSAKRGSNFFTDLWQRFFSHNDDHDQRDELRNTEIAELLIPRIRAGEFGQFINRNVSVQRYQEHVGLITRLDVAMANALEHSQVLDVFGTVLDLGVIELLKADGFGLTLYQPSAAARLLTITSELHDYNNRYCSGLQSTS